MTIQSVSSSLSITAQLYTLEFFLMIIIIMYESEINRSTMKLITAVSHDEKTAKKRVDKKFVE